MFSAIFVYSKTYCQFEKLSAVDNNYAIMKNIKHVSVPNNYLQKVIMLINNIIILKRKPWYIYVESI